jgi:hypothetical protein
MTGMIVPLLVLALLPLQSVEPCRIIHGRATYYTGDGQLRIWHIGTHHTFRPDESRAPDTDDFSPSWDKVVELLSAGGKEPEVFDRNELFADFLICPTQRYREGASQPAQVRHVYHPHVVSRDH